MKIKRKIITAVLSFALTLTQFNAFAEIKREDYATDEEYYQALEKEAEEQRAAEHEQETKNNESGNTEEQNPGSTGEEVKETDENTSLYPKTVLDGAEENSQKYGMLRDMNIMDYGESFDKTQSVTRTEFAIMLSRIINAGKVPEEEYPRFMFEDVSSTNEIYNDISSLINAGVILGYDDGTFGGDKNITAEEALIMVVNLMGFDNFGSADIGKYDTYKMFVRDTKLEKYFRNPYSEVTRENAADILYELLFVNTMEKTINSGSGMEYAFTDKTVLSKFFDYSVAEGIVTANEYTSLTSAGGSIGENRISVDGTDVYFEDRADIYAYLGYRVMVIYDDANNGKAIKIDTRYNKELEILSDKIDKMDETAYSISYENENGSMKNVKISKDITIIFNNAVIDDLYDNMIFTPSVGKLVFIDNDKDGSYEIVKVDSYATYAVDRISAKDKTFTDKSGLHGELKLDNKRYSVMKSGAEIDFSDIKTNDVVMVAAPYVKYKTEMQTKYMTPDNDKSEFYRLIVSDHKVSGAISGISGDDSITIDGKKYELSDELKIALAMKTAFIPESGVTVEIVLDLNGKAAYFNTSTIANDSDYGFLKRLVRDEDTENVIIRLFNSRGQHITSVLPEKVYVYRMWSQGEYTTNNYKKKKIKSENLIDKVTVPELYNGDTFVPQLIRYSTNADGAVDTIYIAADTFGDTISSIIKRPVGNKEIFTREFDSTHFNQKYDGQGYMMYFWYRIWNKETTYFTIPGDLNDDSLYKVSTDWESYSAYTSSTPDDKWNFCGYDSDRDCLLNVLVMRESGSSGAVTGTICNDSIFFQDGIFVKEINEYYDEKSEEIKYRLEGLTRKGNVSYNFESENLVSNVVAQRDDISMIPIKDLKCGDLLYANINSSNEISGFRIVWHNAGDKNERGFWGTYSQYPVAGTSINIHSPCMNNNGYVTGIGDYALYIKAYDDDTSYLRKAICTQIETDVFLLDTRKGEVSKIDFSDIRVGDYVKTRAGYVKTNIVLVVR